MIVIDLSLRNPLSASFFGHLLDTLLKDPALVSRFAELSMSPVEPERATPEALQAFLEAETAKWGKIIKAAGIEVR